MPGTAVERAGQVMPVARPAGLRSQMLETERALCAGRAALGKAQCAGAPNEELSARVKGLEATEAALRQAAPGLLEQVQLQVFVERFEALEKEHGPGAAVTLARNAYYTGPIWSRASGARSLSQAEIRSLGLPWSHPHGQFRNHGYVFLGRHPDGRILDVGHLLCGLDFELHAYRRPKFFTDPDSHITVPNVFDTATTTLIGDLASSVNEWSWHKGEGRTPFEALIDTENNSDLRGDVLGLVMARELVRARETHPTVSVAAALRKELLSPRSPAEQMRDFARLYPGWVKHHPSAAGPTFSVRTWRLFFKTWMLATLTEHGKTAFSAARDMKPVMGAFARWMGLEAEGRNPGGDYPTPFDERALWS